MKFYIFLDIDGVLFKGTISPEEQGAFNLLFQSYKKWVPKSVYGGVKMHYAQFKAKVDYFDEGALKNLSSLIEHLEGSGYDVEIIVSSNWRTYFNVYTIKEMLHALDISSYITGKIYDKAQITFGQKTHELTRAESIELHLKQHPEISRFLILDDFYNKEFKELFPNNFVHCKQLFGPSEYQNSLDLLKSTQQDNRSGLEIQNKAIPKVVKTMDDNRACNQVMDEVSIRVLTSTRQGFLCAFLPALKTPVNKNSTIADIISGYELPTNDRGYLQVAG